MNINKISDDLIEPVDSNKCLLILTDLHLFQQGGKVK